MKIFFSVGEPSGDLHGANLIRQLRKMHPNLQAVGYGGPRMAAAGCDLHADLTQLAIMWFLRVLLNIHKFLYLLYRADHYFRVQPPDAVVLIDYPGFNWWIARRAKAHGIPVFYYGTPQLWAWASWRVRKMKRFVDHVLCKLPFEEAWYRQRGCPATYVGHPYFDQLERQQFDQTFLEGFRAAQPGVPVVTILPGSRRQEVTSNLPWFLRAAALIERETGPVRLAIASYNEQQAELARQCLRRMDIAAEVYVARTAELIQLADCCLACSGSVSLELLYHTKPAVILYWVNPMAYFAQSFFRKVKYITLVNLLAAEDPLGEDLSPYDPRSSTAEQVPLPEYLTYQDKSRELANHVVQWLTDTASRQRCVVQLRELKDRYGQGGASIAAAQYISRTLQPAATHVPRPHFLRRRKRAESGERRAER